MNKIEQAYMDGITDFFQGSVFEANPYISQGELRSWERGWKDAAKDEGLAPDGLGCAPTPLPVPRDGFRRGTPATHAGPVLYAGYGANTHKESMGHRCPGAAYKGTGKITGYRLEFRGVADIVPAWGYDLEVSVWEIDADAERSLDGFEGFPRMYQKTMLPVVMDGKVIIALVYVMRARSSLSPPYPSYEECLRDGYRDCGMDPTQIDEAVVRAERSGGARVQSSWAKK